MLRLMQHADEQFFQTYRAGRNISQLRAKFAEPAAEPDAEAQLAQAAHVRITRYYNTKVIFTTYDEPVCVVAAANVSENEDEKARRAGYAPLQVGTLLSPSHVGISTFSHEMKSFGT